jgi:hypothetical protein
MDLKEREYDSFDRILPAEDTIQWQNFVHEVIILSFPWKFGIVDQINIRFSRTAPCS